MGIQIGAHVDMSASDIGPPDHQPQSNKQQDTKNVKEEEKPSKGCEKGGENETSERKDVK